jgi:hypothetical protein
LKDIRTKKPKQTKPGPKPESLKIEGSNWTDAIKKVLKKKRPPEGWPKPEKIKNNG